MVSENLWHDTIFFSELIISEKFKFCPFVISIQETFLFCFCIIIAYSKIIETWSSTKVLFMKKYIYHSGFNRRNKQLLSAVYTRYCYDYCTENTFDLRKLKETLRHHDDGDVLKPCQGGSKSLLN